MSDVPEDVLADILSRLPVKSLLQFRCVSKPWCALIGSQDFIKLHLTRAIETNTDCSIIKREFGCLHSININSLDNAVMLNLPQNHNKQIVNKIIGSCNGLLCLTIDKYIFLWNPATRMHWKSPASRIPLGFEFVVFGFGYDDVRDDYKVVRMVQFCGKDKDTFWSEVSVYSLKLDSWRRIRDFPYYLTNGTASGVFVNGALHWVVGQNSGFGSTGTSAKSIAAFDLRTEEYWLVPRPQYTDKKFIVDVCELGGCLCVICNFYNRRVNMWVMEDYGVEKSWTKLFSIAQSSVVGYFDFLWPVAYSNSREQVLLSLNHKRFIWYDLTTERAVNNEIGGMSVNFDSCVYLESLIQLRGGFESARRSGRKFQTPGTSAGTLGPGKEKANES